MANRILTQKDKEGLKAAYAAIIEAVKQHQPIWLVYRLTNKSRREIYFGATSREFKARLIEHASGSTKTIKNWQFTGTNKDIIEAKVLITGKTEEQASKLAHLFEKLMRTHLKGTGWKVHQTRGI